MDLLDLCLNQFLNEQWEQEFIIDENYTLCVDGGYLPMSYWSWHSNTMTTVIKNWKKISMGTISYYSGIP